MKRKVVKLYTKQNKEQVSSLYNIYIETVYTKCKLKLGFYIPIKNIQVHTDTALKAPSALPLVVQTHTNVSACDWVSN